MSMDGAAQLLPGKWHCLQIVLLSSSWRLRSLSYWGREWSQWSQMLLSFPSIFMGTLLVLIVYCIWPSLLINQLCEDAVFALDCPSTSCCMWLEFLLKHFFFFLAAVHWRESSHIGLRFLSNASIHGKVNCLCQDASASGNIMRALINLLSKLNSADVTLQTKRADKYRECATGVFICGKEYSGLCFLCWWK